MRLRARAYGNDADTLLPEDRLVLVRTGRAMAWVNAPVALIATRHLIGRGTAGCPVPAEGERILPVFAQKDVIFAATGLQVFCPGITGAGPRFYPVLEHSEAVDMLEKASITAA